MRKRSKVFAAVIAIIGSIAYLLFIRPVSPEVYFVYYSQYFKTDTGTFEFRLTNENPENGRISYFARVSLNIDSTDFPECNLEDFDWTIKRNTDGIVLYSTKTKSGPANPTDYFENQLASSIFKGISGEYLGMSDFEFTVTVAENNECGIDPRHHVISKTMKLKRRRLTAWGRAMSV